MPQRRVFTALVSLLIAVALLTAACNRRERPSKQELHAMDATGDAGRLALDQQSFIGFDSIGLVDPKLHVEPSSQGWDSEVIHDRVEIQLKSLAKLLEEPKHIDEAHASQIADRDFAGGRLRPMSLEVAFADSALQVRRSIDADSPNINDAPPVRGLHGFVTALRELVAPWNGASDTRAKFKVFGVNEEEHRATTQAYFELSGETLDGVIQQRATWTCQWRLSSDSPPLLRSIQIRDFEETTAKSPGGRLFADATEYVLGNNEEFHDQFFRSTDYWLDRIEYRYGIDPSAWVGIAVGDVNGDGLDDLYICQPGGLPNRLFIQAADGKAIDTSREAGVDWLDHTHAALLADLDNDADQDLVLAFKLGLVFMSNDGAGHFKVASTKLTPHSAPYSLSAADFDNDGLLDVYACCYGVRGRALERRFFARPIPYHDANNGGRNVLFRNERYGQFRDVTKHVGLDENNRRFSFASSWEDFDNDGDLDLYVANDYGRNNLYRNDTGHFVDIASDAGVEDISAGMSVSWGDYNNDGWMDLYVSNMFSSAGNRIAYQRRFHANASESTRAEFQRHARGNSLFQNLGNGTFRDVSTQARVTMGRWAWSSNFLDINNDGLEDLIVANGFITQEDTGDL